MGLLGRLLTLPLAPVQGVAWMADQLAAEAARQTGDEHAIRQQLADLAEAYDRGEIDDDHYDRREEELLRRIQHVTRRLESEA